MKNQIIGYLTGMINRYENANKKFPQAKYDVYLEDLNDLLDFVMDIPEEPQKTLVINNEIKAHNSFTKMLEKIKRA